MIQVGLSHFRYRLFAVQYSQLQIFEKVILFLFIYFCFLFLFVVVFLFFGSIAQMLISDMFTWLLRDISVDVFSLPASQQQRQRQ